MENIIREVSEIEDEIQKKEYFLRHECGICDALVNNRAFGLFVTERLLKAYQLEKRDIDGPGSEFDERRKALLLEIDGIYEAHGVDKSTAFMSTDIRSRRQAKRYFADLAELDKELEAAEWISECGFDFAGQLKAQREEKPGSGADKLMRCAKTYLDALSRKIEGGKKAADKDSEDLSHKAYILAVTNTHLCEMKLSAVNKCIKITGESPELIKEKTNREIYLHQAKREEKERRIDDIGAAIANLEAEKEIAEMEMEAEALAGEIKKTAMAQAEKKEREA